MAQLRITDAPIFANVNGEFSITLYAMSSNPINAAVHCEVHGDNGKVGSNVCEYPKIKGQETITRREGGAVFYFKPVIFKEPARGKTFKFFFQLVEQGEAEGAFCERAITVNERNV